jgi:hypothetical protein
MVPVPEVTVKLPTLEPCAATGTTVSLTSAYELKRVRPEPRSQSVVLELSCWLCPGSRVASSKEEEATPKQGE